MKKLTELIFVSVTLFTILISCASKKKAGCDAYSKTTTNKEMKKEVRK